MSALYRKRLFINRVALILAMAAMSTGIITSLPLHRSGVASAVNDTTREVGGAMGIAVIGSVLAARYRSGIGSLLEELPEGAREAARRSVAGGLNVAQSLPPDRRDAAAATVRQAFSDAMHTGLRLSAVVVAITAAVLARYYPAGAAMISNAGGSGGAPRVEPVPGEPAPAV